MKNAPIGSVYTNRELLELMIVHSDNTAAELLIRQLGYDYIRETFVRFGLMETQIHPEGFKLSPRSVVAYAVATAITAMNGYLIYQQLLG